MTQIEILAQQFPVGSQTCMTYQAIQMQLNQAASWEQRYRELLSLAKAVPALPSTLKISEYEVGGCEAKVWLVKYRDPHGLNHFAVDSESRIVKALLITVLSGINHQSVEKIKHFDHEICFNEMGLIKHVSASRVHGIAGIVKEMHAFCAQGV